MYFSMLKRMLLETDKLPEKTLVGFEEHSLQHGEVHGLFQSGLKRALVWLGPSIIIVVRYKSDHDQARRFPMGDEIKIPRELLEQVAAMRLPAESDQRLQELMDRNNNGQLGQR